ncbi:hypothetical protein [Paraburkholderia guartelaensis]|uniref:hypothetical protein n=1 Tax=Paraburkholderia guartelaensis TaxID=2546446 RepID=UPI0014083326|nr:hypothetical protein [Paraburkholderia guartelaensis]
MYLFWRNGDASANPQWTKNPANTSQLELNRSIHAATMVAGESGAAVLAPMS